MRIWFWFWAVDVDKKININNKTKNINKLIKHFFIKTFTIIRFGECCLRALTGYVHTAWILAALQRLPLQRKEEACSKAVRCIELQGFILRFPLKVVIRKEIYWFFLIAQLSSPDIMGPETVRMFFNGNNSTQWLHDNCVASCDTFSSINIL